MLLLSILEKFFLQDGAVSGRNEKDSRPGFKDFPQQFIRNSNPSAIQQW